MAPNFIAAESSQRYSGAGPLIPSTGIARSIVATTPLSDKISERDAQFEESVSKPRGRGLATPKEAFPKFAGKSGFRAKAKEAASPQGACCLESELMTRFARALPFVIEPLWLKVGNRTANGWLGIKRASVLLHRLLTK
jgi:hypothetical protein